MSGFQKAERVNDESGHSARRVDVLILNWNGWRDTVECLESVFRQDYPDYRVIVCDNGSSDGSAEKIVHWAEGRLHSTVRNPALGHLVESALAKPIPVIELTRDEALRGGGRSNGEMNAARLVLIRTGANLGFAGGNNVGLEFLMASGATGYVWLLNNDTVVAPDALSRMLETMRSDAAIGCVGATLLEYDRPDVIDAAGGGRLVRWQGMPRETSATGQRRGTPEAVPQRLDFITCGSMLVPLDVVTRVGLIDERFFMYCEDVDYSRRVVATGRRLGYAPTAEIWHKGGGSTVFRSPRHDYYLVRSALQLVHKFDPVFLPAAMAFSLYRCVLPKVARLQWTRLDAVARGYRDFLRCTWLGASGLSWESAAREIAHE